MYVLTGGQGKGGHQTVEDNAAVLVVALAGNSQDMSCKKQGHPPRMPRFVEFILGVVSKTQLMATPRPYCEA